MEIYLKSNRHVFLFGLLLIYITLYSCSNKNKVTDYKSSSSAQNESNESVTNSKSATIILRLRGHKVDVGKFSIKLTKNEFLSDFGPPDTYAGSGIEYFVYKLDDERWLWLWFASQDPYPLIRATLNNTNYTEGEVIFNGINDTTLR